MVLAMALAACGDAPEAPEQAVQESTETQGSIGCSTATDVGAPTRDPPGLSILAFGDSLFAGYGVCEDQGYPERLQLALQERGIDANVIDAGVSGDTSAAARQRVGFVLDSLETLPDLALVELGGNDLLRGIAPEQTRENLTAILGELQERNIPVLLMGMRAPPNLGEAYVAEFDAIYPALAGRFDAALVPFFLEPVYDKPALIQQDRIHPTAEGIEAMVAATVDDVERALPDG
jgi:acyl-CoA thioesterase-1